MLSSVNNSSRVEGYRAKRGFVCTLVQSSLQKNFSSCYSELAGTAITKKGRVIKVLADDLELTAASHAIA